MKYILALSLAAFFCPANFSMNFDPSQKAAELLALNELMRIYMPDGLSEKNLTSKEIDFVAANLGLNCMPKNELRGFLDHIDRDMPWPTVSEEFLHFDPSSTVFSVSANPFKVSICMQDEKSVHYCISAFDGECSKDKRCTFGSPWAQIGREIRIGPDGRYLAMIAKKEKYPQTSLLLFDLEKYSSKNSMEEYLKGEFEISVEAEKVDCCFMGPRKMVIRLGQNLFDFFISEKSNFGKKPKPPFVLPASNASFFSKTESLLFACGTDTLLVAVCSDKKDHCKMLVLKYQLGGFVSLGELGDEPESSNRVAHKSGFYLTAPKADFFDPRVFLAPKKQQSCTVYDMTSPKKPQKYEVTLGVVSALAISPAGKSFCAAVVTNKEPQLCVYSLLPACKPELVSVIPVNGASVVHRLLWPEWGPGIAVFADSKNAYYVRLGNGIRELIAALRARNA